MADTRDLNLLLKNKNALTVVETYDEARAVDLLKKVFKTMRLPVFVWTCTSGAEYQGLAIEQSSSERERYKDPEAMLRHMRYHRPPSAWVLCDFHHFLDEPVNVRYLKEIALGAESLGHRVVLLSHQLELPKELTRHANKTSLRLPDDDEIMALVREEAREWAEKNRGKRIKTDMDVLQSLVQNLKGLTHQDVRKLAYGAINDDGAIAAADITSVARAKFALMNMDSVLHYEYDTAKMAEVAGLTNLREWLEARRAMMGRESGGDNDAPYQLDNPKGVLLFGVQGGGKSLAAKAIAGAFSLPLLRLDMAALYNKYIGESERNLREALALADLMHPCVLWIDEIEKGLAEDSESGVSKRILGTLLTWMAERKTRVFVVATSNDISILPPELMRKGRFDEIFFVDLPGKAVRVEIFRIHMEKRGIDPTDFDLAELADASEGFTGAEIEQAIVSAVFAAVSAGTSVDEEELVRAISSTRPLSVTMAEKIRDLQLWAKGRAVNAG